MHQLRVLEMWMMRRGCHRAVRTRHIGRSVIVVAALLASCAQPDRGRCLASHVETHYHPTDVFLGGSAGYTHEYFRSEDQECDRWEYPDGRPKT